MDKVTKEVLHGLNKKVYQIMDKAMDAMLGEDGILDEKVLGQITKYLDKNGITAIEADTATLKQKAAEVAKNREAQKEKQRETNKSVDFFSELQKRRGNGE